MGKPYVVQFYIDKDEYEDDVYHRVCSPDVHFVASDLTECPEDATLYRDLFSGYDYIKALETGMKLAQMGYTSIEVEYKDED